MVVCHKSYEMGLDEFSLEAAQARFDVVHQYGNRQRDIVIIDEALDQVAEARVGRSAVMVLLHLLQRVQHKHREAMRVLESAGRALREAPVDRRPGGGGGAARPPGGDRGAPPGGRRSAGTAGAAVGRW